MSNTTQQTVGTYPLVEKYLSRIPKDLRELLGPATDRLDEFEAALKSLRLKEEERYYVMQLQRRHGLSIRPSESVKRTMIRARLAIVRKRREGVEDDDLIDQNDPLPVDPLE
jgi:hypothetical protein